MANAVPVLLVELMNVDLEAITNRTGIEVLLVPAVYLSHVLDHRLRPQFRHTARRPFTRKGWNPPEKIISKHEQPTRQGGWRGAGIGLAAGAVIALFPAAAIGSGLLATTTAGGAILGDVAGHVTGGMSRGDLKDLGEHLDTGETGLIVVAVVDLSERVEAAITQATDVTKKELQASDDDLAQEVGVADGDGG